MIIDMLKYFVVLLWLFPAFTFAQTSSTGSLQQLLVGIGGFLNNIVIPFILAIAFIVFVVNVVRFFVISGASDEGQKNAKNLAIYGIGAFVFILSFWGIVNMVVDGIGLGSDKCVEGISSDYVDRSGDPCPGLNNPPPGDDDDGNGPPPPDDPPDDSPVDPPPDEDAIDQILADIKSAMASALSVLQDLYSRYADAIQTDLFEPILTEQEMTREEEARAIVRATSLGILSPAQADEFFRLWDLEQIRDGIIDRTDRGDIEDDLTRTIPTHIITQIDAVKATIRRQLDAYDARGGFVSPLTTPGNPDATPAQVMAYLFNQTIPIAQREEYLISLIENPHDIIDASLGDGIYHSYIDVNNIITTYSAMFQIIDERDPNYTGPR